MVPAQATGAAFQTLAGARLLFEGDADYQLSDEIIREMQSLSPAADTNGYSASFVYRVYGHPLRGALYPPREDTHSALWFPVAFLMPLWMRPMMRFVYVVRRGFLDGRAGILYAFMLSTYEAMIAILAYEKLRKSPMAKA